MDLVAPKQVRDLASEAGGFAFGSFSDAADDEEAVDDSAFYAAGEKFESLVENFMATARKDLGTR